MRRTAVSMILQNYSKIASERCTLHYIRKRDLNKKLRQSF